MKDSEEEVRDLTNEEKKKFERHTESYSYGYKYEPPKEKAVKINVKAMKIAHVEDTSKAVAVEEGVEKSEEHSTLAGTEEPGERRREAVEESSEITEGNGEGERNQGEAEVENTTKGGSKDIHKTDDNPES